MPDPLIALAAAALLVTGGWWLFRPERGFWPRWREARRLSLRVRREDALKHLYECEFEGRTPRLESLAGTLHLDVNETASLLAAMERHGLVRAKAGRLRLTEDGRSSALHIIRAHRLWERYLADETGFTEAEWHEQADRREHTLSPAGADALAARLGYPTHDPHGDPIPTAQGEIAAPCAQSLATMPEDSVVRIVHLEDEPEVVYAQLIAEGLYPGMVVRVAESTSRRLRLLSRGNEHVLAPLMAGNVSVEPLPAEEALPANGRAPLSSLALGDSARVAGLSPACRGVERRRFLDLGIIPGTVIRAELRSPGGDPTAYRIRGALIAFRRQQAALIEVKSDVSEAKEHA